MNVTFVTRVTWLKSLVSGVLIILCGGVLNYVAHAEQKRPEASEECVRYSLPDRILHQPFVFAGETIPLQRPDVRTRIGNQINFLLFDARSVLTEWLTERARCGWVFQEIFAKEGLPDEFVLFSPVLSGLPKNGIRVPGTGPWMLDKCCTSIAGVTMSDDAWHDDRLDIDISTRCFASKMKAARKDVGGSWLMAAAAYVTTPKTIQELRERWKVESFWDLPPVDSRDDLIVRWIAFAIVSAHRDLYGLNFKVQPPLTFDQVTDVTLSKDLSVAEIARMTGAPPREILELNPKIRSAVGAFPAAPGGKPAIHSVAVPRGKGSTLVEKLKAGGYLAETTK